MKTLNWILKRQRKEAETNHSGLQARRQKGIQDSNSRYQPRLEKVIARLEKEGKLKA